jgi:3-deoxy-manno-octulosonate cytidylyltransferase (CMP-KDO synthetase)
MVVRTAYRAGQAETISRVVVATDDSRIADVCARHDVETIMTSSEHATGTDRIAEASRVLGIEEIVDVQGDEPLIDPACIDTLVRGLLSDPDALVSNACCAMTDGDGNDPNIVKVVSDQLGRLMFLSRSLIPFSWHESLARVRHIGMYAFRGDALRKYVSRVQGSIERAERIEMYRFLEYGDPIALVQVPQVPPAVDVPGDLAKVEDYVIAHGGWSRYSID